MKVSMLLNEVSSVVIRESLQVPKTGSDEQWLGVGKTPAQRTPSKGLKGHYLMIVIYGRGIRLHGIVRFLGASGDEIFMSAEDSTAFWGMSIWDRWADKFSNGNYELLVVQLKLVSIMGETERCIVSRLEICFKRERPQPNLHMLLPTTNFIRVKAAIT